MPTEAEIRTAIANQIRNVATFATATHERLRASNAATAEEKKAEMCWNGSTVHGCVLGLVLASDEEEDEELGLVRVRYRYQIDFLETFNDKRSDGTTSEDYQWSQFGEARQRLRNARALGFTDGEVLHDLLKMRRERYPVESDKFSRFDVIPSILDVTVWTAANEC